MDIVFDQILPKITIKNKSLGTLSDFVTYQNSKDCPYDPSVGKPYVCDYPPNMCQLNRLQTLSRTDTLSCTPITCTLTSDFQCGKTTETCPASSIASTTDLKVINSIPMVNCVYGFDFRDYYSGDRGKVSDWIVKATQEFTHILPNDGQVEKRLWTGPIQNISGTGKQCGTHTDLNLSLIHI